MSSGYTRIDEASSNSDDDYLLAPPSSSSRQRNPRTSAAKRLRFRLLTIAGAAGFIFLVPAVTLFSLRGTPDASSKGAPSFPTPCTIEHLVPSFGRGDSNVNETRSALLSRFQEESGRDSFPSIDCTASRQTPAALEKRYGTLRNTSLPLLIALNLHNSEDVLPSLAMNLLDLVDFFGPYDLWISIFESGSSDRTRVYLSHLAAALTKLEVKHTISTSEDKTEWNRVDRIEQLAVYRNLAMRPIRDVEAPRFDSILFLNDVFMCTADALELQYQRKFQEADATCGLDWVDGKNGHTLFYDNWVTRSLTGRTLYQRYEPFRRTAEGMQHLFQGEDEAPFRSRLDRGLPLPVYSCWNGAIALDARPFYGLSKESDPPFSFLQQQERQTYLAPPVVFRAAEGRINECEASECNLMAKDFWARGYSKFVLVPNVVTTYTTQVRDFEEVRRISRAPFAPEQEEVIDWTSVQPPSKVICWPWTSKPHVDFEWLRARWEAPF